MLRRVEVLLGDQDAFTEEVLVDLLAVGFGDQPGEISVRSFIEQGGMRASLHLDGLMSLMLELRVRELVEGLERGR